MSGAVWDDLAKDQDGLHDPPGSLPDRVHRLLRDRVLRWAEGLPRNARVLDLGCGSGKLARALVRRRSDLRVTGLDISPGMLEVAARRSEDKSNPVWIQGDARRWPLADHSMDAVIALELAVHLAPGEDMDALFREARRVCGRWLLLEIKTPWTLRLVLRGRRLLERTAPRAREFLLGLKEHTERIPIHIHDPGVLIPSGQTEARLRPWPLLPVTSEVHVLDLSECLPRSSLDA